MNILKSLWNNFKVQPDVWFFYGFLITFTLSVRKVIFFYPIQGRFNEYTGIYLYLSDIFLLFTIGSWLISILRNKSIFLSRLKPCKEILFLALALVTWSFVSISWSVDKNIALFRSLKLAEFYLLFIYIAYNVSRETILKQAFQIIISIGLFQAIIGIGQFALQHSAGLFWLKESLISPDIPGVAKIIFDGNKFIRAYGLFPHPDILGGFLLISTILAWQYKKFFHSERNVSPQKECSTWNILRGRSGTSRETGAEQWFIKLIPLFITVQLVALFLTFCKSAILGIAIAAFYAIWRNVPPQKKCSTWNILRDRSGTSKFTELLKMFRMEHLWMKLLPAATILALFVVIVKPDINSFFLNSLRERALFMDVSRETIAGNPTLGVGMGQFVAGMQSYSPVFLQWWQYQPVHTVLLLIWSELGIVGLILFILLLWKIFIFDKNVPRLPREDKMFHVEHFEFLRSGTIIFKGISLGFIFIMLFDHYLWDIQQGQVMLWMVFGIVMGKAIKLDKY